MMIGLRLVVAAGLATCGFIRDRKVILAEMLSFGSGMRPTDQIGTGSGTLARFAAPYVHY
jgi:hypothetical protein